MADSSPSGPTSDTSRSAPGSVELRRGPAAPLAPGMARVRVLACGVCGTDLHLLHGMVLPAGAAYPVRPGHEVCGVVDEVRRSADVRRGRPRCRPTVGTTVVLHPLATCGRCERCAGGRDHLCGHARILGIDAAGGMADEVVWPLDRLVPVDGLPPAQAALLPDAVATAYHALRVAAVPPGGTLCVLGAGGIGTHVLQLARALDPAVRLGRGGSLRDDGRARAAARRRGRRRPRRGGEGGARRWSARPTPSSTSAAPRRRPRPACACSARGGRLVLGSVVDSPAAAGDGHDHGRDAGAVGGRRLQRHARRPAGRGRPRDDGPARPLRLGERGDAAG